MAATAGDSTTSTARPPEPPQQIINPTAFERDLFTTNGGKLDEDALRRFHSRRA